MIALAEQIAEAQRELALRRKCYPVWVQSGKLEAGAVTYQLKVMEAICSNTDARRSRAGAAFLVRHEHVGGPTHGAKVWNGLDETWRLLWSLEEVGVSWPPWCVIGRWGYPCGSLICWACVSQWVRVSGCSVRALYGPVTPDVVS